LVHQTNFFDAILRPVERLNSSDLDGLKYPVIKITLDARQGVDDLLVADAKADAPAGHVVALRKRKKLNADVFCSRHLKKAWRLVAVEREIGVGEIVDDDEVMLLGSLDDSFEEIQFDHFRGRVVRKLIISIFGLGQVCRIASSR
jgi:hypothetical protein